MAAMKMKPESTLERIFDCNLTTGVNFQYYLCHLEWNNLVICWVSSFLQSFSSHYKYIYWMRQVIVGSEENCLSLHIIRPKCRIISSSFFPVKFSSICSFSCLSWPYFFYEARCSLEFEGILQICEAHHYWFHQITLLTNSLSLVMFGCLHWISLFHCYLDEKANLKSRRLLLEFC